MFFTDSTRVNHEFHHHHLGEYVWNFFPKYPSLSRLVTLNGGGLVRESPQSLKHSGLGIIVNLPRGFEHPLLLM